MLFAGLLGSAMLLMPMQDPAADARAKVAAAEAEHGQDSLEVSNELMRLVAALQQQGKLREQLEAAQRALAIREAKLPKDHERTGLAMTNVGVALLAIEEPEQALDYLQRARAILAKAPPARGMLGLLANLGVCESKLGRYHDALATLEAAVDYGRRNYPDHYYLAGAMQNLAQVHLVLGDVEAARGLIAATLELLARIEPGGARYAHAVYGLGLVLYCAGRFEEAEPLLRQSLELRRNANGANSDAVADVETALGNLEGQRENFAAARAHFAAALAIARQTGNRQKQAHNCAELSRVLLEMGELPAARAQAETAITVATEARLTETQKGNMALASGQALARLDEHVAAISMLRPALGFATAAGAGDGELATGLRRHLAHCLYATGSRVEAIALLRDNLARFPSQLQHLLPALRQRERLRTVADHRADLDRLLEWSGEHPDLLSAATAHAEVLAWKGQVARGVLRQQLLARADAEGEARLRRLQQIHSEVAMNGATQALQRERDRLETLLSRGLPPADEHAQAGRVHRALSGTTALVDLLLYQRKGSGHYVAFVVRDGKVTRFELGAAMAVDQAVRSHLLLTSRSVNKGSAQLCEPAAAAARRLVYEPLAEALRGCAEVLISPDASLATLPFETLPGARAGTWLVEELQLRYLQSGLDLVREALPPGKRSLLAIGEIDYGTATGAVQQGVPRPFAPLPATARELSSLIAAFGSEGAVLLRGKDASEARVRDAVPGAAFVHFATHGFWGNNAGDGIASGIALAAANTPSPLGDGILSAEEAELLDLRSCRLVVCSACQTGLGQPFAGEGLLGLRRSLHNAGARATLTSLWRVDDAATALLMADFYRALFGADWSPAAALQQAQLRALERARAASGEGLPGLWGAFVLEGT